jgi:peptidoglycan/LPS O-acetylase OafA/YrhL
MYYPKFHATMRTWDAAVPGKEETNVKELSTMVYGRSRYPLLGGLLLGGLLALFLLRHVTAVSVPFYVILPGLVLLVSAAILGKRASVLAIPGCMATTFGSILFYQQATGDYQSWNYAWALILAAAGVGMVIQGTRSEKRRILRYGMRTLTSGAVLFLLLGTIFALISSSDGAGPSNIGNVLWPLALIGAGVVMILRRCVWDSYSPAPVRDSRASRPTPPPAEEK